MAVDIYDSQYLLILAPSLVIALMFLFFWLFMKETSYDEVLAKQKRDLKLPPSKPDTRKKNEKKKSKKKESASGGGGGGGGESEEDLRDFDGNDGGNGPAPEVEEEPTPVVACDATPLTTSAYVPVSVTPEAPTGLRERKKKEKKAARAAAAAAAAAANANPAASDAAAANDTTSGEPEMNGSKSVTPKAEQPQAVSTLPNPSTVQLEVQIPVQTAQAPPQALTPPVSAKKKEKKKQKAESVGNQQPEPKTEQAPPPVKKEPLIVAETKVPDGSAPTSPPTSGKKKNSAKKQKTEHVVEPQILPDSATSTNHQTPPNDNVPSKASVKKQKKEADKEAKLKELLSSLSSLTLTEAEAGSLMAVLQQKSPSAMEAWHKSVTRPDPAAQERERLLSTLQEEASIAKDKVKQLSQELQVEKQKTTRVETVVREQRAAMEKELGSMQAKAQGSYQELQTMQIKFQQVREQLEGQITRLQQENGILRDAVSSATNQMESKNSAELNKLRSEYAGLMKELADSNSKLQQEEHQRKSLEVNYKQNVSQLEAQLQDAKRRWEELNNFLHTVNAEREKIQASNQELHSQLMTAESEMNNKIKEIQTLHSSLTEAMVSKERLEQRVVEFMEVSQHSIPDESLQARVQELMNENKDLQVQNEKMQAQISSQASHVSHIEEIQKLLADKELQRKSLEDSLNSERSCGANRETKMQALHNDNMSLKAEVQKLQAQISDQAASQLAMDQIQKSAREKEENMKTVESLLEKGLIEVANKEEELKMARDENEALRQEMKAVKRRSGEKEASSELTLKEMESKMQEKDVKLKSIEESLQTAKDNCSAREKMAGTLEQQLAALKTEMEELRQAKVSEEQSRSAAQLQELQDQLALKDQEFQMLQAELETRTKELSENTELLNQQRSCAAVPSPEFQTLLREKEKQVSELQSELAEMRDSLELHRRKNNELREKNWSAMEALSATESMLQGKLSQAAKENQITLEQSQAECRETLHKLLPNVPLPDEQGHQEWLRSFERAVAETSAAQSTPASGEYEALSEKLKEAEETQRILQKDCETYKKVLAETEGILQRLQSSVEQEESRWRMKLEQTQGELGEMSQRVAALEQEVERLTDGAEMENLRREKLHLESELERAERESATYVTEVRELKDLLTELQTKLDGSYTEAIRQNEELNLLKTQLTETLSKLETEENERQKVAGDLYKAQQSLDLIHEELSKVTDSSDELIENSSLTSQTEEIDKKEKVTAGLNQTVKELQQLLQTVSRQLSKGQEGEADKVLPKVQ
ncbi:kinectin isoform X2 [Takifugu rubripes]|uniref:Kinectin 1 n=1 Tax=Takifugu rubripes TaxID=31033 RepID=H2VAS6_TAKRU|nr:kinectin isoform X2 [Takifugu rubripes]